jgi:hypothetical protein
MVRFHVMQETRAALRTLMKTPGLSFPAVLTPGPGIGMNTASFSLVNPILYRRPPFHRGRGSDRIGRELSAGHPAENAGVSALRCELFALVAACMRGRRASKVEAMRALRCE